MKLKRSPVGWTSFGATVTCLGRKHGAEPKAADLIIQRAKAGTLSKARRAILSPSRWPSSFAARKCAPAQTRLSAHSLANALKLANDRVVGLERSCAVYDTTPSTCPYVSSSTRAPVAQSAA